jgi:hypothetical protein
MILLRYFKSIFIGLQIQYSCPGTFHFIIRPKEVLFCAPISNLDACDVTKQLQPTKLAGLDGIPNFVIKGRSEIFVLFLSSLLILAYLRILFSTRRRKRKKSKSKKKCLEIAGHCYSEQFSYVF